MSQQIEYVDDHDDLVAALDHLDDDLVGIDVERADSDRYFRRAALVQVGDADLCVLLDPLAIPEPQPLAELCAERMVVLHAIENDLEPMDRLGVPMPNVADSAIAAAFLSLPIGLGDLLEAVLGVELDTDKSKYQRADWARRPLSQGMKEYAAGDVLHLPELWEELAGRLEAAGRFAWYEQELAATIEQARSDTRHWERTKGAGRLDPDERSALHTLWDAREDLCRTHDIAPNRLVHDKTLVSLVQDPPASPQELVQRDPRRRSGPVTEHAGALFEALQEGLEAPPEPRPQSRRWSDEQRNAYDALRHARTQRAHALDLDPGFCCPSRQLRAAVTAEPQDPDAFAGAAGLRPWQREQLLGDLWSVYTEHIGADGV